jgi:glyoxylase-like metal-dependent hydrolase (beta-lactamase superfamily II)
MVHGRHGQRRGRVVATVLQLESIYALRLVPVIVPRLIQIAPDLYGLDSTFTVWGCKGSVRMSVIRTTAGVVIYSPVRLSADHINQIKAVGPVSLIIAPNLFHHMFLNAAVAEFPEARVLVPQGLAEKIGQVDGAETMVGGMEAGLPGELQAFVFRGHSLRETCLFHTPTNTMITADLLYHYQAEHFGAEKLFFRAMGIYGRPSVPFYHRFAIEDKPDVLRLIDAVSARKVERIVPCHGRIIERADAGALFTSVWESFA